MDNNRNELKLFSKLSASPKFLGLVNKSSVSKMDAQNRVGTYEKVFANYQEVKQMMKTFSGASDAPLLSNQYFDATVASFVNSFAGFISIERAMDNQEALLAFYDVLGVSDNRKVLPNLGAEDLTGIKSDIKNTTTLAAATAAYSVSLGKKVIPGSVKIDIILDSDGSNPYTITDDRNGFLISKPGVLVDGTINYETGQVEFEIGGGFTQDDGDTAVLSAFEDAPGNPSLDGNAANNGNRVKARLNNIRMTAYPDLLMAESDLSSFVGMQKSVGVDPMEVLSARLIELYTKLINLSMVNNIKNGYEGNSADFDIRNSTTGYSDYRSTLDNFVANLTEVDTALAKKSIKGVRATSYLVGYNVADLFMKTKAIGKFEVNKNSSYIDDLIGYYDGVPVLRHSEVPADEGFALHKTIDGQMGPLLRGIFLPLTTTPVVGNYNNPAQQVSGIYFSENNKLIANELVQKFSIQM